MAWSLFLTRRMLRKFVRKAAGESKPEAYPRGTLSILMNRERSMGKGASRRVGVGRVRRATFSASC